MLGRVSFFQAGFSVRISPTDRMVIVSLDENTNAR